MPRDDRTTGEIPSGLEGRPLLVEAELLHPVLHVRQVERVARLKIVEQILDGTRVPTKTGVPTLG